MKLNRQRREALLGGWPLTLRTKEFDLLFALAQNAGTALSRDQLLVWSGATPSAGRPARWTWHVTTSAQHLQGSDVRIETLRGVGYKLTTDSNGDG